MYSQHMISNSAKNAHGERTVSSIDHVRSIGRLYAREILYQKEKKSQDTFPVLRKVNSVQDRECFILPVKSLSNTVYSVYSGEEAKFTDLPKSAVKKIQRENPRRPSTFVPCMGLIGLFSSIWFNQQTSTQGLQGTAERHPLADS